MQRDMSKLDIRLKRMVLLTEQLAWWLYLDDIVVTSIVRSTGTHASPPPYRFIDLGILERGGMKGSETIRQTLNFLFPRSDGKPTVPDLRHGTAPHLHLQVPYQKEKT